MGRIVVFTSEDLNSKQLLRALDSRKLPYNEISLTDRPSRISDLQALVDCPAVPQMFINTRAVGGLNMSLKELKRWDQSARFDSPLHKYESEVAPADDPAEQEPRLAPNLAGYKVVDTPPAPIQPHSVVKLVTGKVVPLREATELMKEAIPKVDIHKFKGVNHRNCFSGKDLIETLKHRLDESEDKCMRFAKRLLDAGVLHHVDRRHDGDASFHNTAKDYYRLQCMASPEVLNTYRLWPSGRRNCVTVVEDLTKRLSTVELASLDDEGLLDYVKARANPEYAVFEDAVCELQNFSKADMEALGSDEMMAMGLNIYSIMLRYGWLKQGIPLSQADRQHYLSEVKFNLAGDLYSMKDWIEVLRGRKGKFAIEKDYRVHFAINMGPHNGSGFSSPYPRFGAQNLSDELDVAGAAFCSEDRNVNVRRKEGKVRLSSIIKQYHGDFCRDDKSLLAIIRKFATGKQKSELGKILDDKESFKVVYHDPELGFHVSSGPWYNQKGVEMMQKKATRRSSFGKNSKDPLGGSEHSVRSTSSNRSSYSWR